MTSTKRINWIDALKALSIFLIVLGHTINGKNLIWHLIYGFHVPLFIILSGITFNINSDNFLSFLKKRIYRMIIPYIIWGIISIIIYAFLGEYFDGKNKISLTQCLLGLMWANGEKGLMRWNLPLWFLPTLFSIHIIYYFLDKYFYNDKNLSIIFFIEFVISLIIYNIKVLTNLPFGIETAIYLLPFFTLGKLLSNKIFNKRYQNIVNHKTSLISVILILLSSFIIISQKNIDYVADQYRNYTLFFLSASTLSLALIHIFININNFNNIILMIGKNTMPILVLHKFPIMFFKNLCPIIKVFYINHRFFSSLIISFLTVFLCLIFGQILKKRFSWLFGEKNIKNI